jgi:hypothetical protein
MRTLTKRCLKTKMAIDQRSGDEKALCLRMAIYKKVVAAS